MIKYNEETESYEQDTDNSNKYTADDFKDYNSLVALKQYIVSTLKDSSGFSHNDSEGMTALCFAVLNGAPSWKLTYIVQEGAVLDKCKKGKTPIQIACQTVNADSIKTLINTTGHTSYKDVNGNTFNVYEVVLDENGDPVYKENGRLLFDLSGNPIYKKDKAGEPLKELDDEGNPIPKEYDCYGDPVKDSDGNIIYKLEQDVEPISVNNNGRTFSVTEKDIIASSSLSSEDILKLLAVKKGSVTDLSSAIDKDGNTLVSLATSASCYGSVNYLLDLNEDGSRKPSGQRKFKEYTKGVTLPNSSGKSAYDIAIENEDDGLKDILFNDAINEFVSQINLYGAMPDPSDYDDGVEDEGYKKALDNYNRVVTYEVAYADRFDASRDIIGSLSSVPPIRGNLLKSGSICYNMINYLYENDKITSSMYYYIRYAVDADGDRSFIIEDLRNAIWPPPPST